MTPAQRQQLFERLAQANPHPTTELIWHTPFQLLLAVLLSAQSTDVGVNRVTAPLFPTLQTPQDLLTLGLATFEEAIRTLGLYRTKSRHAIEMAKILVDQHEGQVPETQVELEALPGVGRKTANVVLNTLYGHPTIAGGYPCSFGWPTEPGWHAEPRLWRWNRPCYARYLRLFCSMPTTG